MNQHALYKIEDSWVVIRILTWVKTWAHIDTKEDFHSNLFNLCKKLDIKHAYTMDGIKLNGLWYQEEIFLTPKENVKEFIEESRIIFFDNEIDFRFDFE